MMYEFQKDLWATLTGNGTKEMNIIMGGRRIGKSTMAQMWNELQQPSFIKITEAIVDDSNWFTVKCNVEVAKWVRGQPIGMWYEHIDKNWTFHKNTFDMHEKIYTMLQLKYGHDRI